MTTTETSTRAQALSPGDRADPPIRLLLNTDPGIPHFFFPNSPTRDDLEFFVDRLALGGIDAFAYCIFEGGHTLIQDSEYAAPHPIWIGGNEAGAGRGVLDSEADRKSGIFGGYPFPGAQGYRPVYEAGEDPISIYAARCHKREMKFLAGFRMNDRHGGRKGWFQERHPEWQIREPTRQVRDWNGAMDFSFPGVREWMLGMMREVAEQYDVDGLELDYMRWCHMFPPSVAPQRHPVLTEFMQQVRVMLDEVGRSKGRDLLLGARVPQRLQDACALGYDIPAWLEGNLVDYLCPSDFMYTDFNADYEELVRLSRSSGCRIYPSIHPVIAQGLDGALLTPAQYRAAAQGIYSAGADGISLYNFQYHWQQRIRLRYPGAPSSFVDTLRFVNELRDPAVVARSTRHYLFYPLWEDTPPTGVEGVEGAHRMALLERDSLDQRNVFVFRLGESDGPGHLHWQLMFNAVNLTDGDEIAVDVNGTAVDPAEVQRIYEPGEFNLEHRRSLGPYSTVRFFLEGLPLKRGANELGVSLLRSDPSAGGRIEIQEVEVIVEP